MLRTVHRRSYVHGPLVQAIPGRAGGLGARKVQAVTTERAIGRSEQLYPTSGLAAL
jgi:hypothetical protein